jgi:hypothetical protein
LEEANLNPVRSTGYLRSPEANGITLRVRDFPCRNRITRKIQVVFFRRGRWLIFPIHL